MTDQPESPFADNSATDVAAPQSLTDEHENVITDQVAEDPHPDENPRLPADGAKEPPFGAIRGAEREKAAKRYTEQVADFERKLEQQNAQWETRFTQMVAALQQPRQEQKPAAEPDFYDNPQEAMRREAQQMMAPLQEVINHNAQLIAGQIHGADKVQQAEQAFLQAMNTRQLDPADFHRVVNSPNKWAAAVEWHNRNRAMAEFGSDPDAARQKIEAEVREKLIQEFQQTGQMSAAAPAPLMPSNLADARNAGARTGPAWAGPPSTKELFK